MLSGYICAVCDCAESSCENCKTPSECANCAFCCCPQTHATWRTGRIRQGVALEYLSLIWMGVEVVGSIGIGLLSMSFALFAFGSDSVIEMASSVVVTLHLKSDSSGWDSLGEKAEAATKFLLAALIPIIGGGALYSYLAGIEPESSLMGIAVAVGAVIIMPILWVQKSRIGKETNSAPLSMDAVQSATCFLMSLALLSGLVVNYFLHIAWADYMATAIILIFVAKEVLKLSKAGSSPGRLSWSRQTTGSLPGSPGRLSLGPGSQNPLLPFEFGHTNETAWPSAH